MHFSAPAFFVHSSVLLCTSHRTVVQQLLYLCHDLLVQEFVVVQKLLNVIAVVESLFDAQAEHLHICGPVEAGDAFAEPSIDTAVFQCHHQPMLGFETLEQSLVDACQIAWIDQCGLNALVTVSPF